ncbi:sulfotransferase 1C4-like [Tubulanus polymorphus]|uniref:sulfotransferase 1C4-like n=1 Tax=Tubulanus polymorphus TaxID=672921 RepID=UPI003DA56813
MDGQTAADQRQKSPTAHWRCPGQFDANGPGFYCGYFTTPEHVIKVRNMDIFEDDCFVVSYPRTGTTLTRETLFLICNDGDQELARQKDIEERVPHLDREEYINNVKCLSRPRLMQSHFLFEMFPIQAIEKNAKIICVMRNPKDALVSLYHFYKSSISIGNYPGSWDDFFRLFVNNRLIYGDFYDHVLSWWNQRYRDNILYLKYEDMVTDPKSNILKICAFLGKSLSDDKIDSITEQTSFKSMRDNPMTNHYQSQYQDNKIFPFIREGKIGGWKKFFTVEQCEIIEKIHADRLGGTGLSFQFE